MALYTRVQFADLCGLTNGNLSNYIARKKIIVGANNLIDATVDPNKSFLQKRLESLKGKSTAPEAEPAGDDIPPKKKSKTAKYVDPETESEKENQKRSLFVVEMEQKELAIRKTKEELELLNLKKQKLQGLLIPTDLVNSVIVIQSESMKIAYNEASENLIVVLGSKKQFSTQEIAEIRTELTKIVNAAIDKGIEISKRSVKNIVREYSEVKGVGERE